MQTLLNHYTIFQLEIPRKAQLIPFLTNNLSVMRLCQSQQSWVVQSYFFEKWVNFWKKACRTPQGMPCLFLVFVFYNHLDMTNYLFITEETWQFVTRSLTQMNDELGWGISWVWLHTSYTQLLIRTSYRTGRFLSQVLLCASTPSFFFSP